MSSRAVCSRAVVLSVESSARSREFSRSSKFHLVRKLVNMQ